MTRAVLIIFSLLAACDAYKILLVFPFPSKSHSLLGQGMVRHLLRAGHEVTILTPYIDENPPPRLHQIDTSSLNVLVEDANFRNIEKIMNGEVSIQDAIFILYITNSIATKALEDENVQRFLEDQSQHFDLVISEWLFNELIASFATVFNAPLIWFSSTEPDTMILSIVDDYLNPAYNRWYTIGSSPLSFTERLTELWHNLKVFVMRETVMSYLQSSTYNQLVRPHIEARGRIAPKFCDIKYNASLVLGNSHVSMGEATRLPQIYKNIGGFHIEDNIKELPEDLKKIMDNARYGVIYFSMGSNLQGKGWPDKLKMNFLNMFGTLNQTVIWKVEENLPNVPKNVHILHWAPQMSILAHPNCVLFITHGGILSTTETISSGKPTIGIPVLGDQKSNVGRAVSKGIGKNVDISYTMTESLKEAIEEVVNNPKYAEKAKELSFIFHDRPIKPGDELVHWAEHVIKTRGAPHLRSPALLVPWFQKFYIDLAGLIVTAVIIFRKAIQIILPLIFSRTFSKKQKIN